jgi:hypothetical protein
VQQPWPARNRLKHWFPTLRWTSRLKEHAITEARSRAQKAEHDRAAAVAIADEAVRAAEVLWQARKLPGRGRAAGHGSGPRGVASDEQERDR